MGTGRALSPIGLAFQALGVCVLSPDDLVEPRDQVGVTSSRFVSFTSSWRASG